jgi:hypothetical protein
MAEIAPTRSRTDPAAPEQHQQRPLVPRRLHAGSFRSKGQYNSGSHNHHSYRHHAKETVQSAIELKPPVNFDHILKRDKRTPESSRRGSGTAMGPSGAQADGITIRREAKVQRREFRPEDVDKARKENDKREEQLRESLKSVEEVGMSSTRQLDDTYYAILEKASILRSTVASIQQLADESRKMHSNFQEETGKMERETTQQLEGYGNFEQQEKRINELVGQLQGSRQRTNALNDRLESARLRVEAFEQQENTREAKRRVRMHVAWTSAVAVLVLIVAIILAKNRKAVSRQVGSMTEQLVKLGDIAEDVVVPARLKASSTGDPYLEKLFDEL